MGVLASFVSGVPFALLRAVAHEGAAPRLADDKSYRFEVCVYLARRGNGYAVFSGELAMRRQRTARRQFAAADVSRQVFNQTGDGRSCHEL